MLISHRIYGPIIRDAVVIIISCGRNGSTTSPSTKWKLVYVTASETPIRAITYEKNICPVLDI
ncbi:hypothetical protein BGAL_0008g00290 [Botrytis galanthina]|uniref:Uncharacterized protein n=1 Tax=Botrytis galanthina TaxID=278940 RepID=A0A4S8RNU9_9HELO|nr:hypothetical protein BGAL_0008g00290 [Botrytis galanthina]